MQINAEVITVQKNQEFKKNDGGVYRGTLLVYRDLDQDKIQEAKLHENTFKFKKPIQNTLDNLKAGDSLQILKEKNDKGYWNIVSLTAGAPVPVFDKPSYTPSFAAKPSYTADSDRQLSIIKQSSLKSAVEHCGGMKKGATVDEVLEVAQIFTRWVLSKEEVISSKAVEISETESDIM